MGLFSSDSSAESARFKKNPRVWSPRENLILNPKIVPFPRFSSHLERQFLYFSNIFLTVFLNTMETGLYPRLLQFALTKVERSKSLYGG